MPEFLATFDIFGLAAALGGLALLGWLVWMLVDNKDLEELNHRHRRGSGAATAERPTPPAAAPSPPGSVAGGGEPQRPKRRGRAA